jgi:hypothetical protein
MAVFRIAVGKATRLTNIRAAKPHQQQTKICSQNSLGKSRGRKSGRNGEPTSAIMRPVCNKKKIEAHTKRATRRRPGIYLKRTNSAAITKQKMRERSIERESSHPRGLALKSACEILLHCLISERHTVGFKRVGCKGVHRLPCTVRRRSPRPLPQASAKLRPLTSPIVLVLDSLPGSQGDRRSAVAPPSRGRVSHGSSPRRR